jgi:transcriptional/translational regulatory protein YebC/TACO1
MARLTGIGVLVTRPEHQAHHTLLDLIDKLEQDEDVQKVYHTLA